MEFPFIDLLALIMTESNFYMLIIKQSSYKIYLYCCSLSSEGHD